MSKLKDLEKVMITKTLMLKVRPKRGGSWLYTQPEDLVEELFNLDVVVEVAGYEVEMVWMTDEELDNLPEFEGW